MSEPKTVLLRREGGVLHLTLNRPELRNALSIAMVAELRAALAAAEADASVRVIVLRGAGGHFCAGGDLKDMAAARMRLAEDGPRVLAEMNAAFGHLCGAFAASKLAIVVLLEGVVMGGGLGLACVADVVLAGETASLRLPETSLGVVPAQIAPFLVERLGYSQARRLAVTGGKLDARQALALGLVHELHVGAELDAALQRVLGEILRCAPGALAATKALMARARLHAPASLVDEAAEAFTKAALGPEGMEGVSAFLEQRKPLWAPL
ncbi:enoyl-CoA hydratase/isomerase family protein [Roseateles sp. PN1]|uniref:enoyl-CoA hydratase/isomerase family protein n=1 Tax=Roseateles sp. PN1 TaxID=3137372 RepID=UPI00313A1EC7